MPTFVELKEPVITEGTAGKISVRIGAMIIVLDESISDSFLQRILKAGANV